MHYSIGLKENASLSISRVTWQRIVSYTFLQISTSNMRIGFATDFVSTRLVHVNGNSIGYHEMGCDGAPLRTPLHKSDENFIEFQLAGIL